jgi:AraC family transcriptional regulator
MQVDIIEQPPLRLHAMRYEGPVTNIGEVWGRLSAWAAERGLMGDIELAVGACSAAPDAQGRVVYHAGLLLRGEAPASDGVEILNLEGGRYASYRLVGPYSGIATAFPRLFGEWLPASGYQRDDRPALEIYRNNPSDTPEAELITDLLVAIK